MMGLAQCSPVATPTPAGLTPFAIAACPSTSSGLVGSSIHHNLNFASSLTRAIASSTFQFWFASIINFRDGPISSRHSPTPHPHPPGVVPGHAADLHLEVRPAPCQRLPHQLSNALFRIPHPSR